LQSQGWDFIPSPISLGMSRAKDFPKFYRVVMEEKVWFDFILISSNAFLLDLALT
jgi:hypothetical protein